MRIGENEVKVRFYQPIHKIKGDQFLSRMSDTYKNSCLTGFLDIAQTDDQQR